MQSETEVPTQHNLLLIGLDSNVKRDVAILHYVSSKVDLGHALMCRDLMSCEEVAKFIIGQAEQSTGYLSLVGELLAPFQHFDALKAVCFNTDFHSGSLAGVTKDSE